MKNQERPSHMTRFEDLYKRLCSGNENFTGSPMIIGLSQMMVGDLEDKNTDGQSSK